MSPTLIAFACNQSGFKVFTLPDFIPVTGWPTFTTNGRSIAFSWDGKWLALGLHTGDVYIMDVDTKAIVHYLSSGFVPCTGLDFYPDDSVLVYGGETNSPYARGVSTSTWADPFTFPTQASAPITDIVVNASRNEVLFGIQNSNGFSRNSIPDRTLLPNIPGALNGVCSAINASADYIALGETLAPWARLFRYSDLTQVGAISEAITAEVNGVAIAPDQSEVLITSRPDSVCRWYSIPDMTYLRSSVPASGLGALGVGLADDKSYYATAHQNPPNGTVYDPVTDTKISGVITTLGGDGQRVAFNGRGSAEGLSANGSLMLSANF